jgi:4-amino-4-deoxy-L-arabinose transferase-like glycosyltransferase
VESRPFAGQPWQFRWLAAAVLFALIVPRIVQRGMFLDGVTYAVLARNMAVGQGTFWEPSFSSTIYRSFFEQPPLGLALQSLAFRLLGDHLFVERLFSVTVFVLTGTLIALIWRRLLPSEYDWLPLFFWALPSVVTWAAINNILENTQALFTTAAVFCLLSATAASDRRRVLGWTCGAAIAVIAAFLVKGPVGLFPLGVPALFLLTLSPARTDRQRTALIWIGLLGLVVIGVAALLTIDPARHALMEFGRTHLFPALEGQRGLPKRSWDIARHLTLGIWARMAAAILLLWLLRRRGRQTGSYKQVALSFALIGLTASIPILVSPILAGHYFVPSVPWFALAAAALALPAVQTFPAPAGRRRLAPVVIAAGLVLTCLIVLLTKGPMERRDTSLIAGLDAIGGVAPAGGTLGTCPNAVTEFGLQSYLQRFFRISIEPSHAPVGGWFVVLRSACSIPAACVQSAGDETVQLYRCGES